MAEAIPSQFTLVNATADGDNLVIAAPGAGLKIRVLGYVLTVTAAGVVSLQDTVGTPVVHGKFDLAAGENATYSGGMDAPAFELAENVGLEINNPTGVDTLGHMTWIKWPA